MVAHRRTSGERDPQLPPELDLRTLPRAVRAELRGLSKEAADMVGGHLVMAGQLVDTDPELAFAHAEAARRRAARLPIVREASAETAYAAGEYVHALSEYRALRRMTGNDEYLPVMADCERALGRYQDALDLAREAKHAGLGADLAAEALMVEAGVREDMGQAAEGLRLLRSATRVPVRGLSKGTRARLCYAYADLLLRHDDETEAIRWFTTAADLDTEGETDADERIARLQGMVLELDEAGIEGWAPEDSEDDADDDDAHADERDGDLEDSDDDLDAVSDNGADAEGDADTEGDADADTEGDADDDDADDDDADDDDADDDDDDVDDDDVDGASVDDDADTTDADTTDDDRSDDDRSDDDRSDEDRSGADTDGAEDEADSDLLDDDTAELGDRVADRVFGDGEDPEGDGVADDTDDAVDGLGDDVAEQGLGDDEEIEDDGVAAASLADDDSEEPSTAGVDEERIDVQGTDRVEEEPTTLLDEEPSAASADDEEPTTLLDDDVPTTTGEAQPGTEGSDRDETQQ